MTATPSPVPFDNLAYLEELYAAFRADPASIPADYRGYFESLGRTPAGRSPAQEVRGATAGQIAELARAYRLDGHRSAWLDPLADEAPPISPRLEPAAFGLTEGLLAEEIDAGGLFGLARATPAELVRRLRETYCGRVGAEFGHIEEPAVRDWVAARLEAPAEPVSRALRLRLLQGLTDAESFERFLEAKFVKKKRFSLEGGESLIPLLDLAIERSAEKGVTEIVVGMAHRGRLNVLANVLQKPASEIFREFEDRYAHEMIGGGDVKYHLGYSNDRIFPGGERVHLSLAFNPSHLEAIYPVVVGRVRAKQDRLGDAARAKGLALVIHGDASFAGQGVVAEVLNMSQLPGYSVGGTLHVIVNNNVGFTTSPEDGRSGRYASNMARLLDSPIFHVNGEDPEAVARVVGLAVDFRQEFKRDVVIDLLCYRKYGHNEGDDPAFTQPVMYTAIARRPGLRTAYARRLVESKAVSQEEADLLVAKKREHLEKELERARQNGERLRPGTHSEAWSRYRGGRDAETPPARTGVPLDRAKALARKLVRLPEGFEPNSKLTRLGVLKYRTEMAEGAKALDWGTAELLALASLLEDGTRVRLSGQDCMRGTFSQRHAFYWDVRDGRPFSPLQHLAPGQAPLEVLNSPLSEFGVLGFDYGYSLDFPEALVLWEAQFGDFHNTAQVIIDQFLCSAEDKWNRLSGLVLLLPHGYEGQGPEHSSARLERFLALSAEDNWQVCNVTTPAQYFHLLRRQVLRQTRKPLVLMTPKSLLRHEKAVSTLEELGGAFRKVIGDEVAEPDRVRRVLLCTGKVAYDLQRRRDELGASDTAIVRLEQLYPFPQAELDEELAKFPRAERVVWVQEEPWNMGAWYYLRARLDETLPLSCVSRPESASPATGSEKAHGLETQLLLENAFKDDARAPLLRSPDARSNGVERAIS